MIITNRGEDLPSFLGRVLLLSEGRIGFDGGIEPGLAAFRRVEPSLPTVVDGLVPRRDEAVVRLPSPSVASPLWRCGGSGFPITPFRC